MLQSSQDLLFVVLSISVLWFTVFLCWLLYQAANVLKNANNIIENLMAKLEIITDAVHYIQDKMDGIAGNMGVISKLASGWLEKIITAKISGKLEEKIKDTKKKKVKS
jgi:predicted PurR-regulated permease PerM